MTRRTITKKQALEVFRYSHKTFLKEHRGDDVAKRTAWNDFTDALNKDGKITDRQYDTWTNPF